MGLVVDLTERVSYELRRESARLTVGSDMEYQSMEIDYRDVDDLIKALESVKRSGSYDRDSKRRLMLDVNTAIKLTRPNPGYTPRRRR